MGKKTFKRIGINNVKFSKIIFPDFLKAIKKHDTKILRQAKVQHYKVNIKWLEENKNKVLQKTLLYLKRNGLIKKN
jgi:hypothetical protein